MTHSMFGHVNFFFLVIVLTFFMAYCPTAVQAALGPTLTTMGTVDTTPEDTEVEITYAELLAAGNEAPGSGTINSFVVLSVTSGTLRIGASSGAATDWAVTTNDVIDASNGAYWIPALNANGTPDAFGVIVKDDQGGDSISDGEVQVPVSVTAVNDAPEFTADFGPGLVTADFDTNYDESYSMAMDADGKAFVVAGYSYISGVPDFTLARYRPDGTLDTGFGAGGKVTTDFGGDDYGRAVVRDSNGKYVVVGYTTAGANMDFCLARYNPDGSLDTGFGAGGKVITDIEGNDQCNAVTLDWSGRIVAIGTANIGVNGKVALVRYNTDGSLDTGFGTGGRVTTDIDAGEDNGNCVVIDGSGKILVGGSCYSEGAFLLLRYDGTGALDNTFDTDGKKIHDISAGDEIVYSVIDLGTKILAAGKVSAVDDDFALLRFNSDGSADGTFYANGLINTDLGGYENALAVTLDGSGRILAAGRYDNGSNTDFGLIRYLSDGTVDTSFGTNGVAHKDVYGGFDEACDVKVNSSGMILVTGYAYGGPGGGPDYAVVTYDSDGILVGPGNTFNTLGNSVSYTEQAPAIFLDAIATVRDAELDGLNGGAGNYAGSSLTLVRQGSADASDLFSIDPAGGSFTVSGADLQAGGQTFGTFGCSGGTLTVSFTGSGTTATTALVNEVLKGITYASTHDDPPSNLAIFWTFNDGNSGGTQGSGGVKTGMGTTDINPYYPVNDAPTLTAFAGTVDIVNEDTEIEITYADLAAQGNEADVDGTVTAFVVKGVSPGSVLRIGTDAGSAEPWAALNNDTIDGSNAGYWTPAANANGLQNAFSVLAKDIGGLESADGSIQVPVMVDAVNDAPDFRLGTGSTISQFSSVASQESGNAVVVRPDGKILVAGDCEDGGQSVFALAGYNPDGTTDTSFGTDGIVRTAIEQGADAMSAVLQADGKIILAGCSFDGATDAATLARYESDGSLDATFGTLGIVRTPVGDASSGNGVTVQSDGKILVAGSTLSGGANSILLLRYLSDGNPDTSFSGDGIAIATGFGDSTQGYSVAVRADGKILVAGIEYAGVDVLFALARFAVDGTLDASFGTGGLATASVGENGGAFGLAVQPDQKIVVGGYNADYYFTLARFDISGSLDASFDGDGVAVATVGDDEQSATLLQPDGKILMVSKVYDSGEKGSIFRFNADGSPDTGFDGDGAVQFGFGGDTKGIGSALLPDGKILVTGYAIDGAVQKTYLARFNNDGTPDADFNGSNTLDNSPTYVENGAPFVLDGSVNVRDRELDALSAGAGNYSGATLTLARNGGASSQDIFGNTGSLSALTQGGAFNLGAGDIGTVTTNSGGTLVLTFNGSATSAAVDEVLQSITYSNSSDDPPATAPIDFVLSDGNSGAQGPGGPLNATGSVTVTITPVNDAPVLTSFAAAVDTVDEDTEIEVTFADMAGQGNEADPDGTVTAFKVKAVSTGSLRVGADSGSAQPWAVTTNDIVDATKKAYWTPAANANGLLNAFTVTAQDNSGAESTGGSVQARVTVTPVNDPPTLTSFAGAIDTVDEDAQVEVTLADLLAHGDQADLDGTVTAFVVKAVSSGTLKIGASIGAATAWEATTNDVVDASLQAYWTPVANANGTLNAFTVVARDDSGLESTGVALQAQVSVTPVNDAPVLDNTGSMFVTAMDEDYPEPSNWGSPVPDILATSAANGSDAVTDIDLDQEGMAIGSVDNTFGKWQVKIGTDPWIDITFPQDVGEPARSVLGQAGFTSGASGIGPDAMAGPAGVAIDPASGKLFVADTANNRVLRFLSWHALTTGNDAEAVLGQADFSSVSANRGGVAAADTLSSPSGLAIDSSGRLFVSDSGNNRILRFDDAADKISGSSADGVLGQGDFTQSSPNRGIALASHTLFDPQDLSVDMDGRLWAFDRINSRVLRFDGAAGKPNGAAADGVLGKPDFTTGTQETTRSGMNRGTGVFADSNGTLWVADGNNRVLRFDDAANKANGADADGLLGQTAYDSSAADETTQSTLMDSRHVVLDPAGRLWVSCGNDRRVMRFDDAAGKADGAPADGIIGQDNYASWLSGTEQNRFVYPEGLAIDSMGRLWVADRDNNRVLRFETGDSLLVSSTDWVRFVPAEADWNGTVASGFTFRAWDQTLGGPGGYGITLPGATAPFSSNQETVSITVNPVNDAPSFTKGQDQTVNEDAGSQTVSGWATGISVGPINEADQSLSFDVTNDNTGLFSVQPAISQTGALTYAPAPDAHGAATVSVAVRDDGGTANSGVDTSAVQTFIVTVNPVNDQPTLAAISNPAPIDEDAGQQIVNLSGIATGAANESQALSVTASSDNSALMPDPTVIYSSPNATGLLLFTPVADQHGTATITVTVTDSGLDGTPGNGDDGSVQRQFTVTVNPVNDQPTLAAMSNPAWIAEDAGEQTVILSGMGSGAVNETQVLTVTAVSDNPDLIPNPTVSYTSPEATGTLKYTPVADANGTAVITVTVTDAGLDGTPGNGDDGTVSSQFYVTVTAVNDDPVTDPIVDPAAIDEDAGEQTVTITGIGSGAANEDQAIDLSVFSGNPDLIPDPVLTYVSPETTCTLNYTPVADRYGSAVITLTLRDAGHDGVAGNNDDGIVQKEFTVTVNPVNDPPTLTAISNPAAIDEDAPEQTVTLSGIGTGAANEAQALTVTASSSNTSFIPDPAVTYTSPNGTGSLAYTPFADQHGTAVITVTVTDSGLDGTPGNGDDGTVQQQFSVTVNPVNDPPTLTVISDPAAIDEDAAEQTVILTGIGSGAANEAQVLGVTASSSNTGLIPDPSVVYTSPDGTGSLVYAPVANQHGTALITVTVTDQGLDGTPGNGDDGSVQRQFTVTVNPVNDAPVLDTTGSPRLVDIYDVAAAPAGMLASVLLGTAATDPADASNGGAVAGIAVTAAIVPAVNSGTPGKWQYSLDGAVWSDMAGVSASSSLLLSPTVKIRYLPAKGDSGDALMTFRAWDGTTGTATAAGAEGGAPVEGRISTAANGGTTSVSAAEETLVQTVISKSLFLTVTPETLAEDAGVMAGACTVSISRPLDADFRVSLSSDRPLRIEVPASVVIKAGQTSAVFGLTAKDDLLLNGPATVTVTAFAPGWEPASDTLTATDDEIAGLTLFLPPQALENGGSVTGTLSTTAQPVSALAVAIGTASAGITVPPTVTVPAGSSSVSFTVTIVDNDEVDGDREVTVIASSYDWGTAQAATTIIDDDDTTAAVGVITVTLPASAVTGDGVLTAQPDSSGPCSIALSTPAAADLTVTLSVEGTGISVPASVMVPAGEAGAKFEVTVLADNGPEAATRARVWAIASGWTAGSAVIAIFDPPTAETSTTTLVKGAADQTVTIAVNPNTRVAPSIPAGDQADGSMVLEDLVSTLRFDRVGVKVDPADFALYTEVGTGAGKQAVKAVDAYGTDLMARNADGTPKVTVSADTGEITVELAAPAGLTESTTRRPVFITFTGLASPVPVEDDDGTARGTFEVTMIDSSASRSCGAVAGDGDLGGAILSGTLDYIVGGAVKPGAMDALVEISPSLHFVSPISRTGTVRVFVSLPASEANLDTAKVSGDGINDVIVSIPAGITATLTQITRYDGTGEAGTGLPAGTVLVKATDFVEKAGSSAGAWRYSFAEALKASADTPCTVEFAYDLSLPLENLMQPVTASVSFVNRSVDPEIAGPMTNAIAGNADGTAGVHDGLAGNPDTALFTLKIRTVAPVISNLTAADAPANADGVVGMAAAETEVYQACRVSWDGTDPDSAFSTRLYWSLSDIAADAVIAEIGRSGSSLRRVSNEPIMDLRMSATAQPSCFDWFVLPLTGLPGVFDEGAVRSNPVYLYAVARDASNLPTAAGGQVIKGAAPVVIVKPAATDTAPEARVVAWLPDTGTEGSPVSGDPIDTAPAGSTAPIFQADTSASIGIRVADDTTDQVKVGFFYNTGLQSLRAIPCLGANGSPLTVTVVPALVPQDATAEERAGALNGAVPVAGAWDTTSVPSGTYYILARVLEPGHAVVETWSAFKIGVSHPDTGEANIAPVITWITPGTGSQGTGALTLTPAFADGKSGLASISFKVTDEEDDPVTVTLYRNRLNTEDAGLTQIGTPIAATSTAAGFVYTGTVNFSGLPSGVHYLLARAVETNRTQPAVKAWTRVPVIVDKALGIADLVASAPFTDPLDAASFAVTMTFTTSKPAVGEVSHGTNGLVETTVTGSAIVTGHSITLNGLAPGLVHFYMVAAEADDGTRYEMDNGGKYYTFSTPAAVTVSPGRWVKGLVSGSPAGTVKAYLVRPAAIVGDDDLVSEPFAARLAPDGSFTMDIGSAVKAGAETGASGGEAALPTFMNPEDTDFLSVEILLDDGCRKFCEKESLNGISTASSSSLALGLPTLWNDGAGVTIDSDIIEARIQLVKGFNMVSIPMDPVTAITASGLLEQLGSDALAVYAYSPVSGGYSCVFRTGETISGTDFELSLTDGFFVKLLDPATLTIRGRKTSRPVPVPVHRGFNLMCVPFGRDYPARRSTGIRATEFLASMGVDGLALYRYSGGAYSVVARVGTAADGTPLFYTSAGDFELRVGQAVFLKMYDQNTFRGE